LKEKGKLSTILLLIPGAGFIFLFLAAAIIMTVLQSLGFFSITQASRFSLEYWRNLFDKEVIDSLLFSLKIGLGSSMGTLLLSYPLALFMRKSFFGRQSLGSLVKIPLFVPALVAAFLIINLIAFHGIVNYVLQALGLIKEPLRMLRDTFGWGVLFIQIWKNTPFQLLIISSSLETIRTDIEDAARNLGAGRLALLRHIILPLSMPGILVAVILVFIMTFGDYAITKVAGPVYPVSLSIRMHTTATMFQEWNRAAGIGVIIIVVSLAFVWLYSRLARFLQGNL
jgi:putative spermidine/putrescine transport system permease protein